MEIAKTAEDDDVITLAQLSKSPPKKARPIKPSSSTSSPAKTKNSKEREKSISTTSVKKRNSDVQIKFVVSGRSGSPMSCKPSMVATDGSCSSGQAKSSAVIRAQEVRSNLEPEFPSFVKSLVRSHVASCFWMGLPGLFCKSHLPDKDTTVTLEDENGKQYGIKYIAYKTGLSAGWRQFAVAHKLLEGDVLVFQLVEPTKFKVYIIRANDLTEVDGALGLLNLDSYTKHNDSDKDNAQTEAVASSNSRKKRPKSLPLSVVQKKKRKPGLPRSVPKPAEQSENNSEEGASEVLEGSKSSGAAIQFQDVKTFENFSIQVDGLLLDSEVPEDIRKTYYKLCCSQNAFLHDDVIKGMNKKLIVGTITETVHIANAIKVCTLTTSRDDFSAWDKSLKAFELLGMNVGFLRARLSQLAGLAYKSEVSIDTRRYVESRAERARAETGMKDIETKLAELKDAFDKFDATVQCLGSQAESYEHKFQQEVIADLW
ncbi:B3 domain-containing protein Os01g0234100 isoform X2 [Morus notabilis]|uniref:B3 domain-containing protein Os01g0234100 isoform X2 n=1 Tax=Morus notabilis TaxID=981085 RepID=UPI000CED39D9|nr:B3 domain-containing protein Os01g0234100 isoform X2 [Morus notabilis]